jgi:hypothetical protein
MGRGERYIFWAMSDFRERRSWMSLNEFLNSESFSLADLRVMIAERATESFWMLMKFLKAVSRF